MDEKPKDISKKSSTGWRGFFLWFVYVSAITFAGFICVCLVLASINPITTSVAIVLGCAIIAIVAFNFRRIFCWPNLRRLLFGFACCATLVALCYVEEDWRARHDWEKYRHEWEARGEKFSFKDFIPPPVPDDQNFALTPIVFTSYGSMLTRDGKSIPNDQRPANFVPLKMEITRERDISPKNGSWEAAKITDLKAWQDYYRTLAATTNEFPVPSRPQTPAQDVLFALSKYDRTIEALRAASRLPYSRFPLEWNRDDPAGILLPHFVALRECTSALRLRAIAELQNAESEKALADVQLSLYLVNSIRTEPILISQLVRIAMADAALQPIYEGLAAHEWSDAQLAILDSELTKLDFLADYEFCLRGERAFEIAITEYWRRAGNFQVFDAGDNESVQNIFHFLPASFFNRTELTLARMNQQWLLPLVDVQNRTISPAAVHQSEMDGKKDLDHGWPYNLLPRLLFPAISNGVKMFAREQSSLDLARAAIALERYRLANGNFPGSLAVLAPRFLENLPHDVIGGQPLHYRRTDDGQFVLYSVGWNETDDGGAVVFKKNAGGEISSGINWDQGDWVWKYPQK